MLTPHSYSHNRTFPHAPQIPSPLSPRRSSLSHWTQLPDPMERSIPQRSSSLRQSTPLRTPNSRYQRPLTAAATRDAQASARRAAFAQRLANDRDAKKQSLRAEDIARLDFRNEQKRWEEEKLLTAPKLFDEGDPEGSQDQERTLDEAVQEVADVYRLEELDLQALVESAERDHGLPESQNNGLVGVSRDGKSTETPGTKSPSDYEVDESMFDHLDTAEQGQLDHQGESQHDVDMSG